MKSQYLSLFFLLLIICSCNQTNKKTINDNKLKSEIFTVSNDTLLVSIKSFGAELSSIQHNKKEYLWQGDSTYWHEQSPLLFPIVGKLKDDNYTYNGKTYNMKFHGFARKQQFQVLEKTKKSISFQLEDNEQTQQVYPFDFDLHVKYTLKNNILNVEYLVKNPSTTEDLYFSIGAHPGFKCPLENNQERNEYQLVFDTNAKPLSHDKKGGLFNRDITQYFQEEGVLKLTDTTFNRGALVFKTNPFAKATLVHKSTGKAYLSVSFKGFPYLGIWSARNANAPFVCIEPWYGLADYDSYDKELTKKEGVQKLEANSTFKASYQIEIH